MEPFDQSEFDVIAIDQIYFICLSLYCKATWFVEQFVFATRDTEQLKPVQELTIRYSISKSFFCSTIVAINKTHIL